MPSDEAVATFERMVREAEAEAQDYEPDQDCPKVTETGIDS